MKNRLTIEVAGIPTSLTINDTGLFVQLQDLYREFISGRDCEINIDINLQDAFERREAAPFGIFFLHDKVVISTDKFSGFLDISKQNGRVDIFCKWHISALGNFLKNVYSILIMKKGGLMLHASGVARRNRAYIFFGPSGSGKSTVARLSYPGAILSDDLAVIMRANGLYKAFGTPYWGDMKANNGMNRSFEVAGLFKLVQDTDVYLKRLARPRAVAEVIAVPNISGGLGVTDSLLQLSCELFNRTPCYEMHFLPDNSFWRCIDEEFSR